MFFLFIIPIGLAIGYAAGGKLSNLEKLSLRWLGLLLPALIIQLLIFPSFTPTALFPYATAPLHILSYCMLALWIVGNRRLIPILVLAAGALCNMLALLSNGGFMPASVGALQKAGLPILAETLINNGVYSNLILMSPDTRLNLLGDLLYIPKWIPFSSAFSIGDLLISLALVWLIAKGMRTHDK
jgi:Family of unknown function (DUF5317)